MWTDKALESLIPIAATLLGSDKKVSTYLTEGSRCYDLEMDPQEWRSWTPGLRAYYFLFGCALRFGNLDILYRLAPRPIADRIYRVLVEEREVRRRDLTREADWKTAVARIVAAQTRQTQQGISQPQQRGWTREDVVAEFYDEIGEPRLGPPKVPLEPRLAEYEQPPGPVRHVSPEEYEATKRPPKYGGVKLKYDKESEHWAKEIPQNTDKFLEGTTPEEF